VHSDLGDDANDTRERPLLGAAGYGEHAEMRILHARAAPSRLR